MARAEQTYADSMMVATNEYLTSVRECMTVLPAALLHYDTDDFEDLAERVSERESAADEDLRELRRLCGRAGPHHPSVYLRTDDLMELYALVDAVPNAAERFIRELAATRPALSDAVSDELAQMAALAVRATKVLTEVIERYVGTLLESGPRGDPTREIDKIADLESRGDAATYGVLERAFADGPSAEALLVRDVARSLDATLDAAEDVADHLLFMHGDAH